MLEDALNDLDFRQRYKVQNADIVDKNTVPDLAVFSHNKPSHMYFL